MLHVAAKKGRSEIVRLLLDYGANASMLSVVGYHHIQPLLRLFSSNSTNKSPPHIFIQISKSENFFIFHKPGW